jgi:hypothetical protein
LFRSSQERELEDEMIETVLMVRCHPNRAAHAAEAAIITELARQRRNETSRPTALIFVLIISIGASLLRQQ